MTWGWATFESIATGVGALATAAAAGFTSWMVFLTKKGIEQTREQHRDAFRPLLVFMPHHGASPEARTHVVQVIAPQPVIKFWGTIRNIGTGPAINGKMKLRLRGLEGYGPDPFDLPPIAAGESYGKVGEHIPVPITHRPQFNETDAELASSEHWEIMLEYEDVFGCTFHTNHTKNPQLPWTTIGRGSAPKGRDPAVDAEIMQAMDLAPQPGANHSASVSSPS